MRNLLRLLRHHPRCAAGRPGGVTHKDWARPCRRTGTVPWEIMQPSGQKLVAWLCTRHDVELHAATRAVLAAAATWNPGRS